MRETETVLTMILFRYYVFLYALFVTYMGDKMSFKLNGVDVLHNH
jgi:hypothetical protein